MGRVIKFLSFIKDLIDISEKIIGTREIFRCTEVIIHGAKDLITYTCELNTGPRSGRFRHVIDQILSKLSNNYYDFANTWNIEIYGTDPTLDFAQNIDFVQKIGDRIRLNLPAFKKLGDQVFRITLTGPYQYDTSKFVVVGQSIEPIWSSDGKKVSWRVPVALVRKLPTERFILLNCGIGLRLPLQIMIYDFMPAELRKFLQRIDRMVKTTRTYNRIFAMLQKSYPDLDPLHLDRHYDEMIYLAINELTKRKQDFFQAQDLANPQKSSPSLGQLSAEFQQMPHYVINLIVNINATMNNEDLTFREIEVVFNHEEFLRLGQSYFKGLKVRPKTRRRPQFLQNKPRPAQPKRAIRHR